MPTKKPVPKASSRRMSVAPVAAAKKKTVAKAKRVPLSDKRSALQKIADIQAQIDGLKAEAVQELKLKLSEALRVVRALEDELGVLNGKPYRKKNLI